MTSIQKCNMNKPPSQRFSHKLFIEILLFLLQALNQFQYVTWLTDIKHEYPIPSLVPCEFIVLVVLLCMVFQLHWCPWKSPVVGWRPSDSWLWGSVPPQGGCWVGLVWGRVGRLRVINWLVSDPAKNLYLREPLNRKQSPVTTIEQKKQELWSSSRFVCDASRALYTHVHGTLRSLCRTFSTGRLRQRRVEGSSFI